jgi:hypothetical protein
LLTLLLDFLWDSIRVLAIGAALIALATTPIAFAVLGRLQYFETRRGRTFLKPTFASVVCSMLLVMGVPAILLALLVKAQYFDKDRYEFDPNRTYSVLDQGRGLRSVEEADEAVRREQKRLAEERKDLVNGVKKLDEAMLAFRLANREAPTAEVAATIPDVLKSLARVRESVGVDGPQQLQDFTAPPVALAAAAGSRPVAGPVATAVAPAPAAAPANGLPKAQLDAELARVPEPQRPLAAMLPLADLPAGWTIGKSASGHIETFNAENLYEKIDGRAESFIQYGVKGMAYTYYHLNGDEASEVQLYVFEMGDALKALGKYASEKSDDAKAADLGGTEGYTSAGSYFAHVGPYYTQVVAAGEDPKLAEFAKAIAQRVVKSQGASSAGPGSKKAGPEAIFALLPAEPKRAEPKYVARDAFGYSFLSDIFMADYDDGETQFQGFLRPYANADEAKKVFEQYLAGAKQDQAQVKQVEAEGADRMVVCSNNGLVDVLFLKGNVLAGANGATEAPPAESFARAFAKALPARVDPVASEKKAAATEGTEGGNEPE